MLDPETMTALADAGPQLVDAAVATATALTATVEAATSAPVAVNANGVQVGPALRWLLGALLTGLTAATPLLIRWLLALGTTERASAAYEIGETVKAYATEAIRHADQEAVKAEKSGKDLPSSEEKLKFAIRSLTLRLVGVGLKVAADQLEGVIESAKRHMDEK